ncbi:MAG: carboxymuconolactone decarboxylase family protein, partial [Cyclobacteriaceae bacterium]
MNPRISYQESPQGLYKAMHGIENYLNSCGLTHTEIHLIKVRASQINGCAFCIDMHTKDALKNGETPQRIFLLNAWTETDLFTEEERVLLKITEEVTLIHQGGLSSETYKKGLDLFGEHYLTQIIMAIVAINAWNRIAISTNKPIST